MRSGILFATAVITFLFAAFPAMAGSAYLGEQKLQHDYVVSNGQNFIALEDLQGPMGLSVARNNNSLTIGGTFRGTLTVNLDTHVAKIGSQEIDFETRIIQDNNSLLVPDKFLELGLGLKARLKPESTDLVLYPEVVAITPTSHAVVITASLPPEYTTFELSGPPRRVVDITGAFLQGANLNVPGALLGTNNVLALRASQFSIDPPTVRVVIEWDGDCPPTHTLFPDKKLLALLVGVQSSPAIPSDGPNILLPGSLLPGGQCAPVELASHTPEQGPEIVPPVPPIVPPTVPSVPDIPPAIPAITPPTPLVPEQTLGEIDPVLQQLGWGYSFSEDGDNLTTTLDTPPFQTVNEFTLTANGGMRLVLDIQGTAIPGDERIMTGRGEINRIRIAQFQPEVTRVVFDLSHVIAYEVENDPVEGRLVVKLLSGDLSGKTIVIDPGHGGEDPGAVVNGVMEKNINLQMAIALKAFLEDQGSKVILTRSTDVFVTLADRVDLANTNHADLMICIHNNATEGPTGLEGSLILYKDTQWMPLYRLAHRAIAARTGVSGLGPVRDQRGIYILRRCEIPVLFVEASFMTNAIDFARLTDASAIYEKNVMMGVADGVLAYYQGRDLPPVQYPVNVRLADAGIFDLGGKPLEFADGGTTPSDSGSAWDNPDQTAMPASDETTESGDAAPDSETSSDESSDASQDDSEDDYSRRRGRGAYRFN